MVPSIASIAAKAARMALAVAALSIWITTAIGGPFLFRTDEPGLGLSLIGELPEPTTLLLLAVGLVVLWWGLRRKR